MHIYIHEHTDDVKTCAKNIVSGHIHVHTYMHAHTPFIVYRVNFILDGSCRWSVWALPCFLSIVKWRANHRGGQVNNGTDNFITLQ